MENVVVHIISSPFWDREWYHLWEPADAIGGTVWQSLLFMKMILIQSFHADVNHRLDDYLSRPENRDKVQRYIDEGKLKIGPFYIAGWLLSFSETNVHQYLDWPSWMR